jgi:hypothetical protein
MTEILGYQYRDTWYQLAPEWLTTGTAERYMYVLMTCMDLLQEKANQAVKIRFPGKGDASQIPYLAHDRLLVQGPAESDESFVLRLRTAFDAWRRAGSRRSILEQLQAYIQGLQPGVAAELPAMSIVGGSYPTVTTWDVTRVADDPRAIPARTMVQPGNFDWDGKSQPWRAWLILYMHLVPMGLSGSAATVTSAGAGSLLGQLVSGVWVPGTSGTAINSPWLTVSGLSGLDSGHVGKWLTLSGAPVSGNNGTFRIVSVLSPTSCKVANPAGGVDGGPIAWSVGDYPFIAPGPAWGTPGFTFGQGESETPPIDTGVNRGGTWQPAASLPGYGPQLSWGLSVNSNVVDSIRLILKRWKSARTYFPNIVIAFDGGTGVAGSAYSPLSSTGSGNPDGTFGTYGQNVSGVWRPSRLIDSPYDCYCQGTGTHSNCSEENVT